MTANDDPEPSSDCTVPPALPAAAMDKLLFRQSPQEAQEITDYVEWQCRGEEIVQHAEKIASERVMGNKHDVWDVHTDKQRWWVITSPTNLYSQSLMPSLDYTLSFHVGLMARVASSRKPPVPEAEEHLLLITSRKMVQVGEALDAADEAEEFQAVGMRCRECLLAFIREVADLVELPAGETVPKAADFPAWDDMIANALAPGASAEFVRGYLKTTGERAWRLVSWLTHAANATRSDAELAFQATSHVIENYGAAALRKEAGSPVRCERCRSYKIRVDWRPDLGPSGLYVSRCEACGAERLPDEEHGEERETE
ncbi:hypothetical protein ASF28_08760 [Methylobacterium sp. Leaf99]|uniref:hypothetical protein n=1 Tax=Methylobacterium sp. Leaf99 TaxID=1736251 RepID=UPI0006FE2252|nr:hypothetical protein [Methylobacterium sp. Leaf99]KQP11127.1 hypothetical protein ASF28_08760 [Methylobacterium sp. Leaf99]